MYHKIQNKSNGKEIISLNKKLSENQESTMFTHNQKMSLREDSMMLDRFVDEIAEVFGSPF